MVLCSNLNAILAVKQNNAGVSNIKCRNCLSNKIVRAGAVYKVEFFIIVFGMKNRGKHGIAVFLLNRKVITGRILHCNTTSSLQLTTLEKNRFGESGLA